MSKIFTFCIYLFSQTLGWAQTDIFPPNPEEATFITSDIKNFWKAFDALDDSIQNPFEKYISEGSLGLQSFIPYRIIGADSMRSIAQRKKLDYEKMRGIEVKIKEQEKRIKPYFYALEYWYPEAVYPPVYFVVGRFNSGGTSSEHGLIIGAEKLSDMEELSALVIHESIHFQQKTSDNGENNLLELCIMEGMADFIAELVTGRKGNIEANTYGADNKDRLCKEFVSVMFNEEIEDWLYGTSGKDDRPNDLGYWIGYEITKAYFSKAKDKKKAVKSMLNIDDVNLFLKESGYLDEFMK